MKLDRFGDSAWRIDLPSDSNRPGIQRFLKSWPRVVDVVVTDAHVLVTFDPASPPDDPRSALELAAHATPPTPREHVIRIAYDGPDLPEVLVATALHRDAFIALHAQTYVVELVGFLPGFAYCGALDPRLHRPRRPAPRPRVPPLSVGIAMQRTAIYPFASPGGWNLIGTALDFRPFDATNGSTLALGDTVRFVPA